MSWVQMEEGWKEEPGQGFSLGFTDTRSWLHATDIVGFAFNADTYCKMDILLAMGVMEHPRRAKVTDDHINTFIRNYGRQKHGLFRDDPRWQDSTVIPQPIFGHEVMGETCATCKERLMDC